MNSFLRNIKRQINILKGFPVIIAIEPTNYCNLNCPLCPAHHDYLNSSINFGYMKLENFKLMIDQVKGFVHNVSLSFRGEPFLHKNLADMVRYCTENKVFSFVNTNGTQLNDDNIKSVLDAGIGRINISLDGLSQDTYSKYRKGGSFKKVYSSIKKITEMRKERGNSAKPEVIVQFMILKHNLDEIKYLPGLKKDLGVDKISINRPSIPSWIINDPETERKLKKQFIPEAGDSRYSANTIQVPKKRCGAVNRLVVTWDGDAYICHFDNNGIYKFGNFFKGETFNEVWFSPKNRRLRKLIRKKELDLCKICGQSLAYKASYL